MARDWKPRPTAAKTTITEIARRYHACAVALAQTLGLSLAEVLAQHRESVTAVFIETSRQEVRLPARVTLPPLVREPEASNRAMAEAIGVSEGTIRNDRKPPAQDYAPELAPESADGSPAAQNYAPEPAPESADDSLTAGNPAPEPAEVEDQGDTPLPTTIPADGDLPCAGQEMGVWEQPNTKPG